MMKIIKKGLVKEVLEFKCKFCDCIWECDDWLRKQNGFISTSGGVIPYYTARSECPFCHEYSFKGLKGFEGLREPDADEEE